MEQYIVSARKYRPITFQTVVGQEALTSTLKNAIATNHLAHAYLFCGPRGVGKTTCARIFAKTINCLHPKENGEACDECESCRDFNEQRSLNIHELDAASNNSVDDIRSLVEQVRIPPQIGKYSVYIIDEVHMLSTAAFNAFLKTLEEPPSYAIFILATTEKHKIIPTILSRCQIYDFNRIRVADTVNYLKYVADNEGIKYDVNALNVIAQKADGAMRDALSIFDQVTAFCEGNITYKGTVDNLNVLDYDYYFGLVSNFLKNEVSAALMTFDQILRHGFEAQHFVTGLASHFRDLLVSRDVVTAPLLEVGDDIAAKYVEQAKTCTAQFLYKALELANECDMNYRTSRNKRLLVELLLIRLCQITGAPMAEPARPEIKPLSTQPTQPVTPTAPAQPVAARPTAPTINRAPATAPVNPTPVRNTMQPVGISLSGRTQPSTEKSTEEADKKDEPAAVSKRTEPFTDEQFVSAWRAYGHEQGKDVHTANTLLNVMPERVNETTYKVRVANSLQGKALEQRRNDIMQFMHNRLKNDIVDFVVEIDESLVLANSLTPEQQFAKMQKENETFRQLTSVLGLELA